MKDFTNGLKIGGVSVYKSKEGIVFVDGNLAVRGAITMYADNDQAAPSIWDGFPYDNITIKRNAAGKFYAVGGGGSGTGGLDYELLDSYLTTNGYATQEWVTSQKYITSSALEPYALKTAIPTNTNQLTNGAGFITASAIPTSLKNPNALSWSGYSSGSYDGSSAQSIALPTKLSQLTDDVVSGKYFPINGGTVNGQVTSEGLRINQSAFDNGLVLNRTVANSGVGIVAMSNDVRLGTFGINGIKTFEISGDNGIVAQVSTVTGEASLNGMTTIKHGGNTPLVINQTYATNNSRGVVLMNGSMANGHVYYSHLFGKAASSKNSAYVGFYNAGAGSDSNYLTMGLYGVNNVLNITAAGNVGIGTTSPSQKLHVAGNILATGAITMYYSSDKRLKQNIRKVNASKTLMSLGGVYQYEYVDSEIEQNSTYGGSHFGLIYQNVKGSALDKMCHEREDGMGTLNYLDANFISLIAGAAIENISEIEKLKRKIRSLEAQVKQLESRA
jgi:hypothetical protein